MLKNLSEKVYIKRLCAFFSGGLVPFAFSPFDFYFFSIFSLSILFYLWSKTKTARESFILGYLFGFAMFGIGVNWLHISIDLFGNVHLMLSLLITYLFIASIAIDSSFLLEIARRKVLIRRPLRGSTVDYRWTLDSREIMLLGQI